jgi:O-antigen/teichoic acid export membrane protein
MIVVWGLLLVVYDLHSARLLVESGRALYPRWKLRRLMALAWLALPLGFSMLVVSLNTNIPRYVLERYQGEAQLGFFAAMAYLIIAGNTVIWSLGQSASPRLAAYYVKGDKRAYVRLLLRLLVISGALGLAGIILAVLVGEWVLSLFYGSEYAVHNDVFVWIMIAGAINYVVFATRYAVIAARVFKVQIVLSGISVLTTGAASLLLIPRGGLQVVATALLVINSLNLFMEIAVMIWVLKKPLSNQTGADK